MIIIIIIVITTITAIIMIIILRRSIRYHVLVSTNKLYHTIPYYSILLLLLLLLYTYIYIYTYYIISYNIILNITLTHDNVLYYIWYDLIYSTTLQHLNLRHAGPSEVSGERDRGPIGGQLSYIPRSIGGQLTSKLTTCLWRGVAEVLLWPLSILIAIIS